MDSTPSLLLCVFTIFAGLVHQYFLVPKEVAKDRLIDLAISFIWVVAGGVAGWAVPLAFALTNDVTLPCLVALSTFMAGVVCGRLLVWVVQRADSAAARRAYRQVEGRE